jgi:GNAT superfamily N-acetyltransferase
VAADDATEVGVFAPEALPAPMAFPTHLQAIDRWRREARSATAPNLGRAAGGAVAIRIASQPDAPAALALLLPGVPPDGDAYIAAEALFHDRLHDPDRPVLLADMDSSMAGVALLGLHQAPRGWHATLDDLAVAPALRRHGVGRALVGAAASLAQARGCALFQVAFPTDESTRAFMAACGFSPSDSLALRL